MEYVEGLPITEYCDHNRLRIEDRLELFQEVCHAVQHAHLKGIIHRDIKPSNILVLTQDGRAVPKMIDFGVAKAIARPLTDRTLVTEHGQLFGTPEFMSPEQADPASEDIDTRSDVYSLGVLLYVLLAGILPFDPKVLRQAGAERIRQIIREQEPQTPSTRLPKLGEVGQRIAEHRCGNIAVLVGRLHKELEWIPLKAMRKERSERYQSASELASDIENYLSGAPLAAGPPSALYRLRKFVSRNRVWVTAAGLVTLAIVSGLVASTTMYLRAQRALDTVALLETDRRLSAIQKLRADGRYEDALVQIESMLRDEQSNGGIILLRAQLLLDIGNTAEATQELEKLTDTAPTIAGAAHYLLAQVHVSTDPGKSERHRQRAEAMLPDTPDAYCLRAATATTAGEALDWLGRALKLDPQHYPSRKAKALLHYGLHEFEQLLPEADRLVFMRPEESLGYSLRAVARRRAGLLDEAIADHDHAVALCSREAELPDLHHERCHTYMRMKRFPEAVKDAQRAVSLKPTSWNFAVTLFKALYGLGNYRAAKMVYDQGLRTYPWAEGYIEELAREHALLIMESDRDLNLPPQIAGQAPFSAMAQTVRSFRALANKATRLSAEPPASLGAACWSPDGRQLAYTRQGPIPVGWQPQAVSETLPTLHRRMGIEVFDLDSRTTRRLVNFGAMPRWSPDGQHIAFLRGSYEGVRRNGEIWLIAAQGGQPRKLAGGTLPVWASDSRRVLFKKAPSEERVYSIRIDDPNAGIDETTPYSGKIAAASRAKRLAYATPTEICVTDTSSGTQIARWATPWPLGSWSAGLSPDGTELSIGGSPWGGCIYDLASGQVWHVLDPPGGGVMWSPDGSKVVALVGAELWILPLDPNLPTYRQLGAAVPHGAFIEGLIREKTEALASNPSDAKDYFERALLRLARGEATEAEADLNAFGRSVKEQDEYLVDMISWWACQYCKYDVCEAGELLAHKAAELLEHFPGREGRWVSFFRTPAYTENVFRDLRGLYLRRKEYAKAEQCTARFLVAFSRHFDRSVGNGPADADPNSPVPQSYLSYDDTADTYTLCGVGADFSGVFDQCHFACKTLQGDGSITARVDSVENRHRLTKAGVMIRSSLDGAARHACAWVTPNGTVNFQYRAADNGLVKTAADSGIGGTLPQWIRVTRVGDMFYGECSDDGATWRPIKAARSGRSASATIRMSDNAYVGLVVVARADPFIPVTTRMSRVKVMGNTNPSGPFTQLQGIGFRPTSSPNQ
jgi:tetratricopeptide (TPR) repeat protein